MFKRGTVWYIETDEKRRISTKCTIKGDALKFLSAFKEKLKSEPRIKQISVENFKDEYLEFMEVGHPPKYIESIKSSFNLFIGYMGKSVPLRSIDKRKCEKGNVKSHV